jgi:hypothetical protein
MIQCPAVRSARPFDDRQTPVDLAHEYNTEDTVASLVRFTVTDGDTTTSFAGPGHAIKMLVAACSKGPSTVRELLEHTRRYDEYFVTDIINGLAVFDEHNIQDNTVAIEQEFERQVPDEWPPFRVYNDATRRACTQPGRAGLIVINLAAKRIIQVQNSYAEIQRQDRGRIRSAGKPTRALYHYSLPQEWALLP